MTEERFRYLPDTAEDEKEMLAVIGVKSMEDLFTDIPEEIRSERGVGDSGCRFRIGTIEANERFG